MSTKSQYVYVLVDKDKDLPIQLEIREIIIGFYAFSSFELSQNALNELEKIQANRGKLKTLKISLRDYSEALKLYFETHYKDNGCSDGSIDLVSFQTLAPFTVDANVFPISEIGCMYMDSLPDSRFEDEWCSMNTLNRVVLLQNWLKTLTDTDSKSFN
jgi:hypothetical protein